jgi:hypothetical protein
MNPSKPIDPRLDPTCTIRAPSGAGKGYTTWVAEVRGGFVYGPSNDTSTQFRVAVSTPMQKVKIETQYSRLLRAPTSSLAGGHDARADIKHVAILGYN